MGKLCQHCGMESDTDRVCSWCGKNLDGDRPPGPDGKAEETQVERTKRSPLPSWVVVVVAVVVLVVLVVGASILSLSKASAVPDASGQWQAVQSLNREFSLQVPPRWDFSTAGSPGTFESVKVKGGGLAAVTIYGSQTMGAIGDASSALARAAAPPEGGEQPLERRAEGQLHATLEAVEKEKDPKYAEQGDVKPCTFAGLPAAYSGYTTVRRVGVFGVKMKGWRISCPGGDYSYDIRAFCPEKQWGRFEPIATKILAGVTKGGQ